MDPLDPDTYPAHIQQHITDLGPILAKAAAGDFSQNVPIPEKEDEFTPIFVGIQLLLDVIREKVANLETTNLLMQERIEEKMALLQSIGDGVVVLDGEGLVTFMNQAACKMSGWEANEVLGHKWFTTVSLERSDKSVVPIEERPLTVDLQVRSENVIDTTTYYYVRKDKTRFPVRTTVTPVQVDGHQFGTVIVFYDVSKEKKVDELKEDFLSLATHQLRSPLTTMTWTLDLLLKNTPDLPAEARQKIENINRNVRTLIELVNDILSVTRVNQDILEEHQSPLIVTDLLKVIIDQLQGETAKNQVKIELTVDDPSLNETKYSIDSSLFQQCVQNLVANAVRYSKNGGTVNIAISLKDTQLCIEVKDQGLGIPEADQAHIFEKFYRGSNIAIDTLPGSGLGLFIVKSLTDRWGGSLNFTSQENVGSTFTVCIPLQVWQS